MKTKKKNHIVIPQPVRRRFYGHGIPGVQLDDLVGKLIAVEGADGSGRSTQIARLVVEGGIQEEALVGEPERLAGFTDAALTESYELLTFRESANGDSPFFESNWHKKGRKR